MSQSKGDSSEIQLVVFRLGTEEYGVPITQVQEINRLLTPTKIPQAPSFVEGIINLRGKIIPIIDLKKRFGLVQEEHTANTRIIVVNVEQHTVGIIVDAVTEVLRMAQSAIEPPPPMISTISADYLKGVGKVDERLLILLDLDKILTEREKAELTARPL
ncbi:chemotaxis protein CheW [Heliobacterium gestii]|uniref:Chemotaxis protein CheW n=1 Tax=Heliomicrobium gestii TaxID=2699 RepID=A0A845LI76_HELGE|nr:chemotaxis protein CheW [Heliomicrobium gestii]MBM7866117.1 purine-binding chemotaxis protein CheW [Heliomicrobium gestii]MZP42556.1 chemotaxis protein CheW [Heliomicrobium gestii]